MKNKILQGLGILSISLLITGCDFKTPNNYDNDYTIEVSLDTTSYSQIESYHFDGKTVVCEFSPTTYKDYLEDDYKFNQFIIGNEVNYESNKYWVDIRTQLNYDIQTDRINKAYSLGCDKLFFSNVDIFDYINDFGINENITYDFLYDLINESNSYGMSVGASENDLMNTYDIGNLFDFTTY